MTIVAGSFGASAVLEDQETLTQAHESELSSTQANLTHKQPPARKAESVMGGISPLTARCGAGVAVCKGAVR